MSAWSETWKFRLGLVVEMQQKLKQLDDLTRRLDVGKVLSFLSVIYSAVAASYFSVLRPLIEFENFEKWIWEWLLSRHDQLVHGLWSSQTEKVKKLKFEVHVLAATDYAANQTLAGMLDKPLMIIANEKSVENLSHSCAVITHSTWISLHKLKLSVNSPCLWALVSPSNPCFIPNFSAPGNWAKLGTPFNELWHCGSVLGLTLYSLFNPQFECSQKLSKIGYPL